MKNLLFLVSLILFQIPLSAQESEPIDLKEYFMDAEYFFAQEEYLDALFDYLEIYNNGYKDNANINYRIGICYLNIPGQKEKAISFLLEAIKGVSPKYRESTLKQIYAPVDAHLYLGNAYRVNNQLNKAIESYNTYKELAGQSGEIQYADQQIAACNNAIRFMDNPLQVRITNLGDSVNGSSSNFKAVISGNGLVLAFMNELPFYQAVYVSRYTDQGWTAPVNITPQIQSDGDQYVSSISYDGTRLFLTREDAFNSDIYTSDFRNGKWTKSQPIAGQEVNTKYWESHAAISRDGETLYFTSNRKGGLGEMDIYKSVLQSGGQWGPPVNLGKGINTSLNEDTPFITENDSILYFSSQGHENMGGYDIFRSRMDASGQWSTSENIRYPLNTTDDDLFYYPWYNARVVFASLIRPEGLGKEDIYAIQPADDKSLSELLNDVMKPATLAEAAVIVQQESVPVVPQPVESPVQPATSDITPPGQPVPIPSAETAVAPPVPSQPLLPKEFMLTPVYFAFDNHQVTPDGEEQLKVVFKLMKDYPETHIKLLGHADAKGPAEYNLLLSKKRASAAMQYLILLGIEPDRLSAAGIGEKNFVAINSNPDGTDNPEGRRLNRRVEYEITGSDVTVIRIKMPPVPDYLKFR